MQSLGGEFALMLLLCFDLDEIDGTANYIESFADIAALSRRLFGAKLDCCWVKKRQVVNWRRSIR